MPDETRETRTYSDKEVSAILRRAAELQSKEENHIAGDGTTLAQLQQSAKELGLSPHVIARAAEEADTGGTAGAANWILGAPLSVEVERVVNHSIAPENWPALLYEIRRITGRVGDARTVGSAFEWTSDSPDLIHVSLAPQGDRSRVSVKARFGEWAAACFTISGSLALIAGVGLAAVHHLLAPAGEAVFGGLFAAAFVGGRAAYQAIGRARLRSTNRLVSLLERPQERPDEVIAAPVPSYARKYEVDEKSTEQVVRSQHT